MPFRPPKPSPGPQSHLTSPTRRIQKSIRSRVPEGGWTNADLGTENGRLLIEDMRMSHIGAVSMALSSLVPRLKDSFVANMEQVLIEFDREYFNFVGRRKSNSDDPYDIPLEPSVHESLWRRAIDRTLGEHGVALESLLTNSIRSVLTVVHSTTLGLLGREPRPDAPSRLSGRVRQLATTAAGIAQTTRNRLLSFVNRAVNTDGLGIGDTVRRLRDSIDSIATGRIPTIARTELGRAADTGRKEALLESGVVLQVSVVGCQAREEGSPQYRGESTCNIQNVPIEDSFDLEFHPNHTGVIVPSLFSR